MTDTRRYTKGVRAPNLKARQRMDEGRRTKWSVDREIEPPALAHEDRVAALVDRFNAAERAASQ